VVIQRGDVRRDREHVIALIERNLVPDGGAEAWFAHYYEDCPVGAPTFWVARDETTGAPTGLLAVIPTWVRLDGQLVKAGVQCDFAVDGDHRGPFGPAVPLVRAMARWLDESDLTFAFGRPLPTSHAIITSVSNETVGSATALAKPIRSDRLLVERGVVPAPVAVVLRPINTLLRAWYREDRRRLGRKHIRVEHPTAFDHRFERLWQEASSTYRVTGERSVDYLNWKYGLVDGATSARPHRIVAALDAQRVVVGYAVVIESRGRLQIHDLLTRPCSDVIDEVIAGVLRAARSSGSLSVSFTFFGDDELLVSRLRSFGFARRSHAGAFTIRWSDRSLADGSMSSHPADWHFVRGDEVF